MGNPTEDQDEFVDAGVPEPTDNNPTPEDGIQDLDQSPDTAYDADGTEVTP